MSYSKKERLLKHANDGLELHFIRDINLEGKHVALGFHGLGGIGHLTSRMIVENAIKQGKGEKVGFVIGRMIPPFVEVLDEGYVGFPYELFMIENKVLILLIRIQPWLDDQPILADIFTQFASEKNVRSFILFGGVDRNVFQNPTSDLPVVYVGNDLFMKKKNEIFEKFNFEYTPRGILVSGGISLFLEFAEYRNIPAVAFFSPTTKGILDKAGALKLAKEFIKLLNLTVDLSEVEEEIKTSSRLDLEELLREEADMEMIGRKGSDDDYSQVFT